ncbi:hypothetical protein ACPEEZ_00655 [Frigoribacterium sp. 2-23]|uniref:hypothetical protein n=1 Tax=Frigoribacterium sp. 2-23 TaxID=3415006 RepID=UPI003C6F9E4E
MPRTGTTSPTRRRPRVAPAITAVLAAVIGLVFFVPLWWTVVNSFRPGSETFRYLDPLQWQTFVTLTPTIENYRALLDSDLARAVGNSLLVSLVTVPSVS